MVEEMYKEETGDADIDSNSSSETNPNLNTPLNPSAKASEPQPKSDEMNDAEMMGSDANSVFHTRAETSCAGERLIEAGYHIAEFERFGSGVGGVSLTLGLQQDGSHNAFMPLRQTDVYNTTASNMVNENAEFECLDSGNRQHRLVSSLLPSFT